MPKKSLRRFRVFRGMRPASERAATRKYAWMQRSQDAGLLRGTKNRGQLVPITLGMTGRRRVDFTCESTWQAAPCRSRCYAAWRRLPMAKQPDWTRLERERRVKDESLYESQLVGPDQRCAECNKLLGDEEQGQRICELCSAGVPCDQDDPVQSA